MTGVYQTTGAAQPPPSGSAVAEPTGVETSGAIAPTGRRTRPDGPQGPAPRPSRRWPAPGDDRGAGRGGRLRGSCRPSTPASWRPGSPPPPIPARWSATWRPSRTRWPSCSGREALVRVAAECARGPGRRRGGLRRGAVRARVARRAGSRSRRGGRGRPGGFPARQRAEAAAGGHRIRVGCLLTAMRHAARSREIAELAVRYRDDGVVGFDIAGAEAGFPPTRHLDAFEYLRRENGHFTIHAGEAFGLPSIWEALQWCGADRLGHGCGSPTTSRRARGRDGQAREAGGLRP